MAKIPPATLARLHPEVERRIHQALEDERAKQADPTTHVRLSSIGRCVRDLWGQLHGVPDERPPGGRALMTFDVGRVVESAVIEWLVSAGYEVEAVKDDWRQHEVVMGDRVGVGHLDGVIRWGHPRNNDRRLLEIKSAKASKFDELIEAGSYRAWNAGYYDQIQAYMGASQTTVDVPSLSDALVVVVCKDDSRLWCEMVRYDQQHYGELVAKAHAALGDEMPNRPPQAKGKSSSFCKWCSRAAWCYSATAGVEFDE